MTKKAVYLFWKMWYDDSANATFDKTIEKGWLP